MEFADREELKKWLETQPKEVSVMIASRAALRVLPYIDTLPEISNKQAKTIVLPVFRALILSWASSYYPAHEQVLTGYAAAAADAGFSGTSAFSTAFSVTFSSVSNATFPAGTKVTSNAAFSAGYAAFYSASAFPTTSNATFSGTAFFSAYSASYFAAASAISISYDATQVEYEKTASEMQQMPLWGDAAPQELVDHWQSLKSKLLALDEDWDVWTSWYEARLTGKPIPIEELEIARATISNELWEQGPAKVNAHIKKLIEQYTPKPKADLSQRIAPYQFYAKDGKILASPLEGDPQYPGMAEDLRAELAQKITELQERLTRSQTSERVDKTLKRLLDALGNTIDDVKPGILLSRGRSLEADIDAYDTVEGRKELAEDALAGMKDMLATFNDLKACYKEIGELEASALAQKLTGDLAEEFMEQSDVIIKTAEQNDKIVSPQALEGLKSVLPDIEALLDKISTELDDQKIADGMNKVAQLVALHSLNLRNFVSSVIKGAQRAGEGYKKEIQHAENKTELTLKVVVVAGGLTGMVSTIAAPVAAIAALGIMAWIQFPSAIEDLKDQEKSDDDEETDRQDQPK